MQLGCSFGGSWYGNDNHHRPRARDAVDSRGVERCGGKRFGARCPDGGGRRRVRHAADHVADDLQRVLRTGIWRRLRRGVRCSVVASREPVNARVPRRRRRGDGRTQRQLICGRSTYGMSAIWVSPTTGDQIMYDEPVGSDVCPAVDVRIVFPGDGVIRIESARLFADSDGLPCRRFIGRVFLAPEIDGAVIARAMAEGATPAIELRFDAAQYSPRQVLEHVAALLDAGPSCDPGMEISSALTARDQRGAVRYHRYGQRITGWRVVSERIGAIKLENPVLYRKAVLCEAVERELMSVLGVDRYETSSRDCCAKIEYDPRQLGPVQIIEILDGALA